MNHRNSIRLVLGGMALLGVADTAFAVNRNVPGTYATIQAGIDAAVNGDVVIIAPGTYLETIDFLGKDIIVRSADRDPTTVTIDADGAFDHVVEFSGIATSNARLIGVTVTGSTLSGQTTAGGGIYVPNGKPRIRRCIIRGNTANVGAGIYANGNVEISQCLIYDNVSGGGGAGIYLDGPADPAVINCLVTANESTGNLTSGIFSLDADAVIRNSIVGSNDGGAQLNTTLGSLDVEYCNIEGGWAGTGNFGNTPLFVNFAARDFRLTADSPCIDAGDSTVLDPGIVEDIAQNPRRLHDPYTPNTGIGVPTIDVGAYEFIPRVRYVDADAVGARTGITWNDAYVDFVDAINAVTADADADEIWVANGTYKPDQGTGDRFMSFSMKDDQTWRGGFAGDELFADEADWLANETILGGAIGGSGIGDNSHHVVTAVSTNDAVIDGFIIQKGYAESGNGGGGMWIIKGSDIQANRLWIRLNESPDGPGGIYVANSSVTFDGVRINRNVGDHGGGLNADDADLTFTSCVIGANHTTFEGAGGIFVEDCTLNMLNSTIYGNSGDQGGTHGVQANNSFTKLYNSILWANQGNEFFAFNGDAIVSHTTGEDWTQNAFGDLSNNGTDPQFVDLDGPNNVLGDADDNFQLSEESNCIDSASEALGVPSTVDILGNFRQIDDNGMPNTGVGKTDRGAVEHQGTSCAYDCDDSGDVGINDLLHILGAWGTTNGDPLCEYVGEPGGDGFVDVLELLGLLGAWGGCP